MYALLVTGALCNHPMLNSLEEIIYFENKWHHICQIILIIAIHAMDKFWCLFNCYTGDDYDVPYNQLNPSISVWKCYLKTAQILYVSIYVPSSGHHRVLYSVQSY